MQQDLELASFKGFTVQVSQQLKKKIAEEQAYSCKSVLVTENSTKPEVLFCGYFKTTASFSLKLFFLQLVLRLVFYHPDICLSHLNLRPIEVFQIKSARCSPLMSVTPVTCSGLFNRHQKWESDSFSLLDYSSTCWSDMGHGWEPAVFNLVNQSSHHTHVQIAALSLCTTS